MLVREALDRPDLRLALLTGADLLERPVTRIFVTDLPDPSRYLSGGEIVLTGLMWRRGPDDSERFASACAAAGVAAIGAGDAALGSVPEDLVEACRRHRLPLFEVPVEVSFRDIVEEVTPSLWAQRASGLAAELGRQRGLVTALAGGARPADLLGRVAADLGVRCWLLTATGRQVAGTGELAPAAAARLAAGYLRAVRLPVDIDVDGRRFTVTGVPGRPAHRVASWLLVGAPGLPDAPDAPGAPGAPGALAPEALAELVNLVALERAQLDEVSRVERRLAEQLDEALSASAEPGDLRARLRSCGLPPDGPFTVVTARLLGAGPADLTTAVLGELVRALDRPAAVAGRPGGDAMAVVAGEAPSSSPPVVDPEPAARLRAATEALAAGLRGLRLAIGVSDRAAGTAALPGAVEEAGHALRVATAGDGTTCVVAASELSTHLLLLAGVPAESRRAFRSRLLGPVLAYDRTHGADLMLTLDTFLACAGSWSRCAERLHVHVNTLRYRIGRIEQLTGRDLGRFEDRVDFFLALRLPPAGRDLE